MERRPNKAPGKYYRKGLSLIEAMNLFPTDAAASEWFEEVRWGGDPACCDCGSVNVQCGTSHPIQTHRCRDCRKFFSVTKGTAMERTKLGLRVWAIAIYLMGAELKGWAGMKLRRNPGIKQKAGWHLARRLRQAWEDNNGLSLFFWSMLDRAHMGTFHRLSPKHLQRCVNEFCGRHNVRGFGTIGQMRLLAKRLEGKPLRFRGLIADTGVSAAAG